MTHNPIITKVTAKLDDLYKWLEDAGHTHILAVCDNNTAGFAHQVKAKLDNDQLLTLSPSPGDVDLVPDERAIDKIFAAVEIYQTIYKMDHKSMALIAVGSGSICDLTRYVASKLGLSYYVVATAASMDGYTSTVTAPVIGNLKQTYPADAPAGVLADPDMYSDAPALLTAAGFGDIMGKFTSITDWEMEGRLGMDGYCKILSDEMHQITLECFKAKTPVSIMGALIDSGLVMQKAGHSRPAAGAEHHLSHHWEMMALMEGKPPALHGAKVGVATLVVLQAQEWLVEQDITDATWARAEELAKNFDVSAWHDDLRRCYSHAAEEVIKDWPNENSATRLALLKSIRDNWPALKALLSENIGLHPQIEAAIADMGGPTTPASLGVGRDVFVSGIHHANRLRVRFTVWRLLDLLGLLPEYAERLADAYFGCRGD